MGYSWVQVHRNVFEHGEDRSFRNGPSSPFQLPMQFNKMHVRYSIQNPKEIKYIQLIYVLAHPFLGASFAPDNNN